MVDRRWFRVASRAWLLILVLMFSGCVQTQPYKTKSALIVWKSPQFRYADMGFISDNGSSMSVEIYGAGKALMRLKIGSNSICMSRFECMSKELFNSKLLSSEYPKDTLERIFRGQEIFGGVNLTKDRNGFTQNIKKSGKYQIDYSVLNNQTIFRDTINKILIKVKVQ